MITVTASDDDFPDDKGVQTIWDDYCLIAAGSAEVAHVQVSNCKDGTQTHVITVKGVRRAES